MIEKEAIKREMRDRHSPARLVGCELELVAAPAAFGLERHKSLMRRSSKSWHVGMIVSIESDHTMSTRSSRCYRVEIMVSISLYAHEY